MQSKIPDRVVMKAFGKEVEIVKNARRLIISVSVECCPTHGFRSWDVLVYSETMAFGISGLVSFDGTGWYRDGRELVQECVRMAELDCFADRMPEPFTRSREEWIDVFMSLLGRSVEQNGGVATYPVDKV